MITRGVVRDWLLAYMNREIDAAYLAQWARMALDEGRLFPDDEADARYVLLRLRELAARAWGLTWDELVDLLEVLGYEVRVTAEPIRDEETAFPVDDAVDHFDSAARW